MKRHCHWCKTLEVGKLHVHCLRWTKCMSRNGLLHRNALGYTPLMEEEIRHAISRGAWRQLTQQWACCPFPQQGLVCLLTSIQWPEAQNGLWSCICPAALLLTEEHSQQESKTTVKQHITQFFCWSIWLLYGYYTYTVTDVINFWLILPDPI